MKVDLTKYINLSAKIFFISISIISIKITSLNADDKYLNEIEIDSSTKFDSSTSDLPTNPFEIVEMLRRANSMNDATNPSTAIDDALKSFKKIEEKENL